MTAVMQGKLVPKMDKGYLVGRAHYVYNSPHNVIHYVASWDETVGTEPKEVCISFF